MSQCPSHNCYGPRGALGSQLGGQRGPSSPPPSLITDCGLCPAPTTALLGACAPITNGQHHQEPRSSLSDSAPRAPGGRTGEGQQRDAGPRGHFLWECGVGAEATVSRSCCATWGRGRWLLWGPWFRDAEETAKGETTRRARDHRESNGGSRAPRAFPPGPSGSLAHGAPALGSRGHPASPPVHALLHIGWLEQFCQQQSRVLTETGPFWA